MKKQNHNLYLLPKEKLTPSWEDAKCDILSESKQKIKQHTTTLHWLSTSLFAFVIFVEIAIWQLADIIYDAVGFTGMILLVAFSLIFGLMGTVIIYTMGVVEESLRREVETDYDTEGEDDYA